MIVKEIGKTLEKNRKEKNYSLVDMQTLLKRQHGIEIDPSNIMRYEKGTVKTLNPKILKAICKTLNIDYIPLFVKLDFLDARSNVKFEHSYKLIEIPVFSSVSAGFGYVPDALPIEYVSIPETEGDIVGIRVSGDSMEKTIYDGDIIVVKKDIEVNIGDIGVFLLNKEFGDGVVKRLVKKNGVLVLESDNPYYKPIEIKSDEIISCGKVVKIIKNTTNKQKDPFVELFNSLSADKQQDLLTYAEFLKNKK